MRYSLIESKSGADKLLSLYWFVVIVIISGGVIAMAYNFYGAPYDVRGVESAILSNKVADCISSKGELNGFLYNESGLKKDSGGNFLQNCGINFNVENENNWAGEPQYFIDINFYNVNDTTNSVFEIKKGNLNIVSECYIKTASGKDYQKLVKCDEERVYALDNSGKQYLVKIISGVKKTEKNAKL